MRGVKTGTGRERGVNETVVVDKSTDMTEIHFLMTSRGNSGSRYEGR